MKGAKKSPHHPQDRSTPTLQVPTFWDGDLTLWESGLIAEYLLETYSERRQENPPLATFPWRPETEWHDKLVFSTVQTFGNAATTISQMKWTGIAIDHNAHLQRSAVKLAHILGWLEGQIHTTEDGFSENYVSMQDIFLAAHVRFIQARPLGIELDLPSFPKIQELLDRLDKRKSFVEEPVWWWEPGIIGYEIDGTPILQGNT